MNPRWPSALAWVLLGAATAAVAISLWLIEHAQFVATQYRYPIVAFLDVLGFYVATVVGAVLATRRPRNPIGWLLLVIGTAFAVQDAAGRYAGLAYARAAPGPVGAAALHADWLSSWLWAGFLVALPYLLLLFPDGRPPSRRWRWLAWSTGLAGGALLLSFATAMWLGRSRTTRLVDQPDEGTFFVVFVVLLATLFALSAAAAISLIVRYRRAHGVERLQVRWLAAAGSALVAALVIGGFGDVFGVRALALAGEIGGLAALVALPVSIAVAVLRYRLYDIDRIVSRTVSYALLTGVLGSVYLAAVLASSRVFAPLGAGSELAVAAATLATAALFAPARQRIQAVVDRRFNRARYDAEQVVTAFRERLRDAVALGDVVHATRSAVTRTVDPAAASVWLRAEGPR
jgi:hypothetical protein